MRTRSLFALLFAALFAAAAPVAAEETSHGVRVVVLDAGHGGWDPGACRGKVQEKDLTLKVVLRLGELIEREMPGVKVVYTRKTDKALAPTKAADLKARAAIANKAGGDLFLSVHVNAAESPAARGVETLIMGESAKEESYNSNTLMENNRDDLIDMSDEHEAALVRAYIQNLQFTYGEYSVALARGIQSQYRRDGRAIRGRAGSDGVKPQLLLVLYGTDMPSALTEIGFLSNAAERAYMTSEKGLNEIARGLLRAVKEYSARLSSLRGEGDGASGESETGAAASEGAAPERTESAAAGASGTREEAGSEPAVRYTIQVLASKEQVAVSAKNFKSYRDRVKCYTGSGKLRNKYCVGVFETRAEAQRELKRVRKTFPDAFVVRCRGTQIVK